jgi:adenylate cyclase
MTDIRVQRCLSAILAADVVGYSRLMGADETGTFDRLRALRKELFEPEISKAGGRIFKLMGDGLLAEFGSVVNAVECATTLQQALADRNRSVPDDQRIEVRMGINLGDVIVEGEDRHGDGVNVAARLQAMADPGGIIVSGTAFDQLKNKVKIGFEFLGDQRFKNIAEPVRIYRALGDRPGSGRTGAAGKLSRSWQRSVTAAGILLLVIATAATVWLRPWEPKFEPKLPLPNKPSIAVLPFTNMSSDPGQENFADGMTDDIITDLSKISALFVIARNSTFVYKAKSVNISKVAEDLGVRYILEGSVQRAADQMRVNAQLIDAATGGHVWADRFDGKIDDVFSLQDTFVHKIVDALEINLTKPEQEQIASVRTNNVAAKEAFDEGWSLYLRFDAKSNAAAIGLFQRAIELDPEYGRAYAAASMAYFRIDDYLWFQELGMDSTEPWHKGQDYLKLAGKYPTALGYVAEALFHVFSGEIEEAVGDAGRAIALDPNDPEAHIAMAWALTTSGKPNEALDFVASAIRLNPIYPSHYVLARGIALFAAGDLKQAAQVLAEGVEKSPRALALPLASVLAQLGRREEASRTLLMWQPGMGQVISTNFIDAYVFPFKWKSEYATVRERLYDGIRVASLPLTVTVSSLAADLKQDDPFTQTIAVQRLGWFGPAAGPAVPALVALLPDEHIREQVVQSLGKIGPQAKAAIPALVEIENESIIGYHAKDALKEIRGF